MLCNRCARWSFDDRLASYTIERFRVLCSDNKFWALSVCNSCKAKARRDEEINFYGGYKCEWCDNYTRGEPLCPTCSDVYDNDRWGDDTTNGRYGLFGHDDVDDCSNC